MCVGNPDIDLLFVMHELQIELNFEVRDAQVCIMFIVYGIFRCWVRARVN